MQPLDALALMMGTANLLALGYNFIAYARYTRRGISELPLCLALIATSFAQGLLGLASLLAPEGPVLFWLVMINLVLSIGTNTLLIQMLVGILGDQSAFTRRLRAGLYILPIAALLLALTQPLHGGMLRSVVKLPDSLGYRVETGVLNAVVSLLSSFVMVAVFVLLFISYRKNPSINRFSVVLIFLSVLAPSALKWIETYVQEVVPSISHHITMFLGWIPIAVICYVYYGYLRTARNNAIELMQEAYAVYDKRGRCVDANPAFEAFSEKAFGEKRPAIRRYLDAMGLDEPVVVRDFEFEIITESRIQYFTANSLTVSDGINRSCGDGIIFREVTSIRERMERLDSLACNDELTGAGNRRFLYDRASDMLARAADGARPVTMLMFDIDNFKRINDTYGHPAGDEVLVALCRICEENLRRDDMLVRYGGEEFIVLCEDMPKEAGIALANRLHCAIRGAPVTTREGPVEVTVSIGGCTFTAMPDDGIDHWINTADRALYRAKRTGRDRIVYDAGDEDNAQGTA